MPGQFSMFHLSGLLIVYRYVELLNFSGGRVQRKKHSRFWLKGSQYTERNALLLVQQSLAAYAEKVAIPSTRFVNGRLSQVLAKL